MAVSGFISLLFVALISISSVVTRTPSKEYNVQLDLTLYDPSSSFTGKLVTFYEEIGKDINEGRVDGGCKANASCRYNVDYGDKSSSAGYMVKDVVQYDSVPGDFETKLENESVIFGCGNIQSGNLVSSDNALDGILGFGNSNASLISQLASSGKVKKMFAHCLDGGDIGGGIFVIGHVVQPEVTSVHLIQDQVRYTVNVTGIKILSGQSNMSSPVLRDPYTCIESTGSVDDDFPAVTFHFENSVSLKVVPHDYLFAEGNLMCLGWQNNDMDDVRTRDSIVLGDLILLNKLVLYDLEKQTLGWTEYNFEYLTIPSDKITIIILVYTGGRVAAKAAAQIARVAAKSS
ncbi:hypothetical protein L1987_54100 [Smallanthus sonchifolius]|uniref:Uncharacterized protein n=1 Tax=Smallanthus sonchifolius TaxID=185202 RepID=A0ACB9E6V3_9ASTR|nr:hypothetical protein L1987_54100 [Smallanthus sonchifolius]